MFWIKYNQTDKERERAKRIDNVNLFFSKRVDQMDKREQGCKEYMYLPLSHYSILLFKSTMTRLIYRSLILIYCQIIVNKISE